MTAPVFLAATVRVAGREVPLKDVPDGSGPVVLTGDEGRHASKVQRLQPGERVDLVDGRGLRMVAEVTGEGAVSDGLAVLPLELRREPERSPELILVQALAKGGRDEQAIETATELGVDRVIPWVADRSIVRWTGPKVQKSLERWQRILTAAMKQSRRASLPVLEHPVTSKSLAARVAEWTEQGDLVLVCHEEATEKLSAALAGVASPSSAFVTDTPEVTAALTRESNIRSDGSPRRIAVLVGPEGGVAPEELDALMAAGATPVLLGPEVLRSSTAGPAALVAANLTFGRW